MLETTDVISRPGGNNPFSARITFTENYSDERSGELTGDAGTLIEFTKAIREAREPVANMADWVNTIRVAEAVYLAVRDGHQGEIDLS